MIITQMLLGFFVKIVTGLDDALTRTPLVNLVAKTRKGKIAFSLGTLAAILSAILLAVFFSDLLLRMPYYRIISALLILFLAILAYFDFLLLKPVQKAEERVSARLIKKELSAEKFIKLILVGFIASLLTLLDDLIAYTVFLKGPLTEKLFVATGILCAAITQIVLVIKLSEKISNIKYKKEAATLSLILLAVLVFFGVL